MDPRSIGDHTLIKVHDNDIKQLSSNKYLGVHIVQDLSWHTEQTAVRKAKNIL